MTASLPEQLNAEINEFPANDAKQDGRKEILLIHF